MGTIGALSSIREIEDSLVQALTTELAGQGVRVVGEPNPGRSSMPLADRECLVGWIGDRIGELQSLARGRCAIERRFRIHLRLKSLRDHRDSYDLADRVLNVVHFLQIQNAEPGYPTSAALVGYDEPSGFYAIEIECVFKSYVP